MMGWGAALADKAKLMFKVNTSMSKQILDVDTIGFSEWV